MAKGLETVISVVDKTAAPFLLFEKRLHHALGPVKKLEHSLKRLDRVSGFKGLREGFAGMRDNASKAVKGIRDIGLAVDFVGRAFRFGLDKMNEVALRGDDLAKTSRRLGLSVESLQKFRHAADLAGVPIETMQESMRRLAVNAVGASNGVKKQSAAFKALGINVKNADGSLKDNEQLIIEMSNRFSKVGYSAAEKLYAANEIFGKSGAKMVELLNQGPEAIRAQFKEMEKLGIMTEAEAKASEEYNDALAKMRRSVDGLMNSVGGKLLPVLTKTVDKMTNDFVKNKEKYMKALQPIIDSIPDLAKSFTDNMPKVLSALGFMMKAVGKFVDWFGVKWPLITVVVGSVVAPIAATIASICKMLWMPLKVVFSMLPKLKGVFGKILLGGKKFFGFFGKQIPKLGMAFRGLGFAVKRMLGPVGLAFTAFEIWKPTLKLIYDNLDMIKSITFDDLIFCVRELDKSFDGLRNALSNIPLLGSILKFMGSAAGGKVDFSGVDAELMKGDLTAGMQNSDLMKASANSTKTINNNTRSVFDVNFNNVPQNVSISRRDYGGPAFGPSMQPAF